MNEDLSSLRDPLEGHPLIREGDELVARSGVRYPIVNGIPRFVSADNYAADFGAQWNRFPATQLDSHTGIPMSRVRLERCFDGELPKVRNTRVLEAGSGAGRFTEILLEEGARLDSFDYSNAVEANARNNGERAFTLVQGDIGAMPFERGAYDYVVCLGVLQHTPDTDESIARLWAMLAPGGRLILDHYAFNIWLSLPPPLGDAEKLYRSVVRRLPPERRFDAIRRIVDFWFPIYWRFRDNRWARRVLARIAGIHFYYGIFPLSSREQNYEWSLLDTHDGMTDYYKRYRTLRSISAALERLGPDDFRVWRGGNGIEAWARKPR